MTSRTGSSRGLTLIEVLVSVAMLATGTVFIMQSFAGAADAHARIERQTAAWLFAVSKIDELALTLYEGQDLEEEDGTFRADDQVFEWRVQAEPDEEDPQLRAARVTVSWRRGQELFTRRLDTLVRLPLDV